MTRLKFLLPKFTSRKVAWSIFLLINAFLWYYLTLNLMSITSESFGLNQSTLLPFHSLGVIVGGIVGLFFPKGRYNLLCLWTLFGVATSLLWTFIFTSLHFQFVCFAWGFSFGLGLPSCLGYFAESIAIEKRGRFSGAVLLLSFSCAIPISSLVDVFELSVMYLFLSFWRFLGFIPLFILKNELKFKKNGNYTVSVNQKKIWLYFIPWFIFNIVDNLEILLLRDFAKTTFPGYYTLLQLVGFLFLAASTFLGGFLCDLIGRKPVTILGFTAMGLAYAAISITPLSSYAWFLFHSCNGFSWGLFDTIFIMVIWGDLASKSSEEKYYFVGNVPFFLATIFREYFASYITLLSEVNAFSLAAILLFLAVIPLLYAPETLPEKAIRERELRSYIEKAKKIKEKFT